MKIQQAIFTSANRSQIKGYHLVAKSIDIDRSIESELCRWSPSQFASTDPNSWTINYYPISEDWVAVSRTILGGPEYSGRGGAQVITRIAVLSNEQFAAYQHNAVLVARTAMALGWLLLPGEIPNRSLEPIELPDYPLGGVVADNCSEYGGLMQPVSHADFISEATKLIMQKGRLAIIGCSQPLHMVSTLIDGLSVDQRREFSFSTGLSPARHRPFQAHLLSKSNPVLEQLALSEGITSIQAPADAYVSSRL